MAAAEHLAVDFDPMTENATSAMGAYGRHRMNGAFEGVEVARSAIRRRQGEASFVVVSAHGTGGHQGSFLRVDIEVGRVVVNGFEKRFGP